MKKKDVKPEPMKFQLELTDNQAFVLVEALDVYSRLHMGQIKIALDTVTLHHDNRFRKDRNDKDGFDDYLAWRDRIHELSDVIGQVFTKMPIGASFGIRAFEIPDCARIAWDIHQVVRHSVSWARNPKGNSSSVYFDEPWKTSATEELAKCKKIEE